MVQGLVDYHAQEKERVGSVGETPPRKDGKKYGLPRRKGGKPGLRETVECFS